MSCDPLVTMVIGMVAFMAFTSVEVLFGLMAVAMLLISSLIVIWIAQAFGMLKAEARDE